MFGMDWKLAEAKQRFSEVVRLASKEPQVIFNRDRPVAAVIPADALDDYLVWRADRKGSPLRAPLQELVEICREEAWEYQAPPRVDRPNPLDRPSRPKRASRRHERSK